MSNKKEFLDQFDHLSASLPLQGEARAAIHNGLDFPTTRDEYWKYTRVNAILNERYAIEETNVSDVSSLQLKGLDAYYAVFVNGVFAPEHSMTDLPDGLEITSIAATTGARRERLLEQLGQYTDVKQHAFNALNTSYFKDGVYVTVEKNIKIDKPVVMLHISSGARSASNVRNLIHLGTHAQAEFLMQYEGLDNAGAFTNALTEIVAEEGANGICYLLQNEGDGSKQVNTTQVVQKRNSTFSVITLTKSGELIRNNLNFSITEEGCESNMYGIYFTSGKQHLDNHTYADHLKPNCNSNELYKGVMTGRSTGVFNGKIMVHQDAQQTNAFQSNQNILLSDTATINTKPELEIYADDVKCSHGCTIGQLDEEAMFYLQSRGLGKEAAINLLIQAFAGDVFEFIKCDALREEMERFIQQKFEELDA
jgi:Fe-S cluster assembly protein SufD